MADTITETNEGDTVRFQNVEVDAFRDQVQLKSLDALTQVSDFRCQHLQRQYEIPYRNINFSHLILRSSSFMFPSLLTPVEVKTTICNSLITMFTTSWRNLI